MSLAAPGRAGWQADGAAVPGLLVVGSFVQPCLSTGCTAPGMGIHRAFHMMSYVTYKLCYLRFLVRKGT